MSSPTQDPGCPDNLRPHVPQSLNLVLCRGPSSCSLPSLLCSCQDLSQPGTGLSPLNVSLSACVKCQQVNGYTTVQTALGHYEPNRKKETEKRKKKRRLRKITKRSSLMVSAHPFPFSSFTFS